MDQHGSRRFVPPTDEKQTVVHPDAGRQGTIKELFSSVKKSMLNVVSLASIKRMAPRGFRGELLGLLLVCSWFLVKREATVTALIKGEVTPANVQMKLTTKQHNVSRIDNWDDLWQKHRSLLHPDEATRCLGIPNCKEPKNKVCVKKDNFVYCQKRCPSDPTLSMSVQYSSSTAEYIERTKRHHEALVRSARSAPSDIDVVLLGDSLTELWNGTRLQGSVHLPHSHREPFQAFFTKQGGGSLEGLALGASGDTSQNLLWHLQNGMLPESLRPKLFMILIGTNDIGNNRCSSSHTVAGVLSVVKYVQEQRPSTPILLHGLLPRGGNKDQMEFNWKADSIQVINELLRKFASTHPNVHYMDSGNTFVSNRKASNGQPKVNLTLLPDALHPSVEGLNLWGPLIIKKIHQIIG